MLDDTTTQAPRPQNLGDRWRADVATRARPAADGLGRLARSAGEAVFKPHRQPIQDALLRLLDPEAVVGVAGVYSSGKSTLLNTVAGAALLPEAARPSSAVPTHLRGGAAKRFAIVRVGPDGHEAEEEIGEEELLRLRLGDGDAARRLDGARRIECRGVLPPALDGFALVDTRGGLDADGGADRTAEAAEREDWDAVVGVTLHSPGRTTVPPEELRFFKRVVSARRPFLLVVNLPFDEPLEEDERATLWTAFVTELRGGPVWNGQALAEGGLFPIHLPTAKDARLRGDTRSLDASGYSVFEAALVEAVAARRWRVKVSTFAGAVMPRARLIADEVAAEIDSLRADRAEREDQIGRDLRAASARVVELRGARAGVREAKRVTLARLEESFRAMLERTDERVAAALKGAELQSLKGIRKVAQIVTAQKRQEVGEEVTGLVVDAISAELSLWTADGTPLGLHEIIEDNFSKYVLQIGHTLDASREFLDRAGGVSVVLDADGNVEAVFDKDKAAEAVRSGIGGATGASFAVFFATIMVASFAAICSVVLASVASFVTAGAVKLAVMKIIGAFLAALAVKLAIPGVGWILAAALAAALATGLLSLGTEIKDSVVKDYPDIRKKAADDAWPKLAESVASELDKVVAAVDERSVRVEAYLERLAATCERALHRHDASASEEYETYSDTLRRISEGTAEEKVASSGLPNPLLAAMVLFDQAITGREADSDEMARELAALEAWRSATA